MFYGIIIAVALNLLGMLVLNTIAHVEHWLKRTPARKGHDRNNLANTFLYPYDYRVMLLGDGIGVSAIDAVLGNVLFDATSWWMLLFLLFLIPGAFVAYLYDRMIMTDPFYKLDYAQPYRGMRSWTEQIHLLYITVQVAVGCSLIILLFFGRVEFHLVLAGIAGLVFWGSMLWQDIREKRITPVKPIETEK